MPAGATPFSWKAAFGGSLTHSQIAAAQSRPGMAAR